MATTNLEVEALIENGLLGNLMVLTEGGEDVSRWT